MAAFEAAFAHYVGAKYGCAVSSCTAALHLTLLTSGVKPGDYVITVSHSFIATANAICYCGATPLFIDIDPQTYNISPQALDAFLSKQCSLQGSKLYFGEKRIAAILIVHQIGLPCDMSALLSVAHHYHLPLIEDAACAIGSEVSLDNGNRWEKIGKPHGIAACFSFHPRKVLSTGEGGMITTNDPRIDQQLRLLRQHGMSLNDLQRHQSKKVSLESYEILGFNYRMTDIQAAIGIEQLKKLPQFILSRREIDQLYRQHLKQIKWLELPTEPAYARSNWQSYAIRLSPQAPKSRDQIMQILLDKGIMTKPGVMNAHQEKVYSETISPLPESEKARREVILLPFHSDLSENEIKTIAEALKTL